jgi:prepilin-type N-terminal cleavage/methylation domain-containing protein
MQTSRPHHRPGFTLMELILVLAIIIIVGAIAVPVMQTMLDDARVSAAGDTVRGKLAETRSKAMEECRPWKLGFIANTGVYQYAPEDSAEWDSQNQDVIETDSLVRDELPKGTIFALTHEDIFTKDEPSQPGLGWETIAVFLPDGSARDDTTTYFGKLRMGPMRARLRGLTGTVAIENYKTILADQP